MITSFLRLLRLSRVIIIYQLDRILFNSILCPSFLLWWIAPIRSIQQRSVPAEKRLVNALIELGPIFVKFGQSLSTRVDLLDPNMADALAQLQDKVPPFSGEIAQNILEKTYQKPIKGVFSHFDEMPLGSASIAQVHAASLLDGSDVVVKILRPDIKKIIQRDLTMLNTIAGIINRVHPKRQQLRALEVIDDYSITINNELNLILEASNMNQMQRAFIDDNRLHIPNIYWNLCRHHVMVSERIYGIPITHIDTLKQAGTDMHKLARDGVELFLSQVFQHNFFHADMHPGNIFVDITIPKQPRYQLVDFGIVGVLDPGDQRYLAENLSAFFARDYQKVAELHIESGWVAPDTSARAMGASIRAIGEPIYGKPLHDISFAEVLLQLFRVAEQHQMIVQPQLLLLQKTLFHVEGLARRLDDSMALPDIAEPIIRSWLGKQKSVLGSLEKILTKIPDWLAQYPEVKDAIITKILHKPQPQTPKIASPSLTKDLLFGSGVIAAGYIGILCLYA